MQIFLIEWEQKYDKEWDTDRHGKWKVTVLKDIVEKKKGLKSVMCYYYILKRKYIFLARQKKAETKKQ